MSKSHVKLSRARTANSHQNDCEFVSRSFTSMKEFVSEYKQIYFGTAKAKDLYHHILNELKRRASEGNIESFKKLSSFIDYISHVENKVSLRTFYDDTDNPIKSTNLVILACQNNEVKILEYLLGNGCNILNNLTVKVGKNSILPDDKDETGHNAFYYAIRSGSVELIDALINKWNGNYFAAHLGELEIILSKGYEELKLKNILLSDEMEIFIESKLIDLRFYSRRMGQRKCREDHKSIVERIELVLENISLLNSNLEVGERFLFIAKFIASNIHILKNQLKSTYGKLPWEEIEFCLVSFISSHTKQQEINLFYQATLNKEKILDYLKTFADLLKDVKVNIKCINISKFILSNLNREKIVLDIIESCPQFQELYNDYQFIRDISSLGKISHCIDLVSSVDAKEREGQLVITRVLQVMGEYFKNTLESPKLSSTTSEHLLLSLPKNTRKIVTDLRNSLSHAYSLSKRTEIEENTDVNFFAGIQKDVQKIGVVIKDNLYQNKFKLVRNLLKKIIDSETLAEITEVAELLNNVKVDDVIKCSKLIEHKEIEKLIDELNNVQVSEKSEYEKGILNKIKDVINVENAKLSNTETNYAMGLASLKGLSSLVLNNKIGLMSVIKISAEKIFNNIPPKLEPRKFKEIAELSSEFYRSVIAKLQPEQFDEVSRLLLEICYISEFGKGNITSIEKLRKKFTLFNCEDKDKKKKIRVPELVGMNSNHLALKLSELKSFFSKFAINSSLIHDISFFKSNKTLQASIEMLVLDIMSILANSNCLERNIFLFDCYSPSLTGKCLRNHLAHDNALLDVLPSDPSMAVVLNAKKLVAENVIKKKEKIGNSVRDDPSKLRDKYDQGLVAVTNQERMFVALEEGNLEDLKNYVNKGADLNARNVNLWTSGHFAAKGPSLEVMKFIQVHNLKFNVKNINSQTPLHIAATYGRKSNVEFLVEVVGLHVDDLDNDGNTPLHFAAQNGHKDIVEVLLNKGSNYFAKGRRGYSALNLAVENNFKDVVETLLKKELNVDCDKALGGVTSLHIATERGHLELVNFLLQRGADANAKTDNQGTSLHMATMNSHKDVVIALLLKGADINAKYLDGCTPLHYAVLNGHKGIVEVLLKHGVNVNVACTKYYNTPLHYASKYGYEEIVNSLLLNGANANATTVERLTPLYFAARDGHVGVVNMLLKQGVEINAKNIRNSSALHIAAERGHAEIVKILIKNKASVNAKDNNGITPLHFAALGGHSDVMDLLIRSNAEVDAQDKVGETPLFIAAMNGSLVCIALLLKNKADVNGRHYRGLTRHTPLFASALNGHIEAVELLIENEAEINAGANIGLTPLHASAQGGHKAVIDILIENKAEVNVRDVAGNTPLHTAVDAGHKEVIKLLLAKGSDVNVKNKLIKTPFQYAVKNNREEIVEILIAYGANVDSEANELFSLAILSGFKSITEILLKNCDYLNIKFLENFTLLHIAAKSGHDEIVSSLIRNGADVHAKTVEGDTPLHIAAKEGKCEVVKVLLNSGAKINIKDYDNRMPVEMAVYLNRLQVVKTFLQYKDVDVNAKGNDDFTLLHIAAQQGNLEMIKLLTDNGANINAKNNSGSKPIHIAARDGFKDIVEFFLSTGISINDLGISNQTLLHYAAQGGQSEVVKYLVQQGVDVNAKNTDGQSPMHLAAYLDQVDIIKVLLNNGAVYNAIDIANNKKPLEMTKDTDVINLLASVDKLFKAVKCNCSSEVKKCIKDGAIVNAKNAKGETPLHIASWKGYESIVDILLNNKGNPNAVGKDGFTPMHYAAKFSHLKVVKILLANGAKYKVASHSGKTPLDFAVDEGIIKIIKLVSESFKNVINGNSKVIDELKKVKDIDTIKAVMNARDRENKTLVVVAMLNNFSKVQQLKEIFQEDVATKVDEALTLANNDNYQKALSILRNAFEKRKEILGPDNPGTLDIQLLIAFIVYTQGYYQEALGMYEEILQKQKVILGFNCKDALKTRDFIALLYCRLGRNEEALIIYKEVIKRQKEIFQPNDLDCLNTQLNMALVLDGLEKYEDALSINRAVFIKFKEILGSYDPSTLRSQNNVAMVLFKLKNYEEALKIYKEVYENRKVALGVYHSDTLRTLYNMALILVKQNKINEALETFKEILYAQKTNLGPYHVDTLNTQYNMANLLFNQCMFIGALKAYKEGFEQRKAIFGPSHFTNVDSMKKIKVIYKILQRSNYEEADINLFLNNLSKAANNGDLKTVLQLLKAGADINEKDFDGRAPLHFAADKGHTAMVNFLIKNGAEVTQVTSKLNTALHMAASNGYAEIAEVLLQHVNREKLNDFVDAKTIGGCTTSLHVASKNGSLDVVKILLKYGATYNMENKEGKTPLNLSKDIGTIKMLKLVEELFEDSRNGNVEIIDKLKAVESDELRAVINARNDKGKTLIQVAVTNQHRDLACKMIRIAKN